MLINPHVRRGVPLVAALALGCSPTTEAAPAPAPDPGSTDAATDQPCDAPTIAFARSTVAIAPTRDHHVTFVHEVAGVPYLYVLGGEQEDFKIIIDDVQRATIGRDGALSAFEHVGTIPGGRAGAAVAVVGDDVVLAGGVVGKQGFTDEVLVGRIGVDGRLDTWRAEATLPKEVQHAAAIAVNRNVYVFGGTTGLAASKISVGIAVSPEGKLSPATDLTPLTVPRSHHAAFVDGDAIYLVGGFDVSPIGNPPSRSDVVQARILPDGTLSTWSNVGALSSPLSVSAVQRVGCSILFAGGLDDSVKNGPYSDRVLRGSLAADGSFRSESALPSTLSERRGHVHQTPLYDRYIYSVGGRANDGSTLGVIDIGTIAE